MGIEVITKDKEVVRFKDIESGRHFFCKLDSGHVVKNTIYKKMNVLADKTKILENYAKLNAVKIDDTACIAVTYVGEKDEVVPIDIISDSFCIKVKERG